MDHSVLTFFGIALLLTITPGADTVLVIKNTISNGKTEALVTGLGITTGLFAHAVASTLGLSVILAQSAEAYYVVKMIGAAYLIYLGAKSLWGAWKGKDTTGISTLPENSVTSKKRTLWGFYMQGVLCNVLNPKVAVFYLTFLPQFIQPESGTPIVLQGLMLAGIHALQGVFWLTGCAFFVNSMRSVMTRPSVRRKMEALTGATLILFGAKLALERR